MAREPKSTTRSDNTLPLIIVNPKSASGSTREKWAKAASDVRAHFGAFNVAFTERPGHAIELAEQAALAGHSLIIACGGDGTINEVANGILRSGKDAELGVLPSGTGGDFRRTLGMPSSSRDAAIALKNGITKTIDVGKVTFTTAEGDLDSRFFLNISSVGLAASVIKRVKSASYFDWLPVDGVRGKANFAVSALQEAIDPHPITVKLLIDDEREVSIQTICLGIANARFFGGGMMIAPKAKLTDGLLDVVNVGDMNAIKILINAFSVYKGTHLSLDEVKSTLVKKIEVSASDGAATPIEIDGELPGRLPAVFEIVSKAIRVRIPRKKAK